MRGTLAAFGGMILSLASAMPATAGYRARPLFVTGDPAPGVSGAIFNRLKEAALNDLGQVAFSARMQVGPGGVTSDDEEGVWGPSSNGGLQLLLRETPTAPDGTGKDFDSARDVNLSNTGTVAFSGHTRRGSISALRDGIWGPDGNGGVTLYAEEDTPAPNGNEFGHFDHFAPSMRDDRLVFYDDDNETVWEGQPGPSVTAVFSQDDPTPQNPLIYVEPRAQPGLTAAGDVITYGNIEDLTNPNQTRFGEGFWRVSASGAGEILAMNGDAAPGTADGELDWVGRGVVPIRSEPLFHVNDDGGLAFIAGVSGPDATIFNQEAIFATDPEQGLALAARRGVSLIDGSPVETPDSDPFLSRFGNDLVINGQGRVAFTGSTGQFTGGQFTELSRGLWIADPDDGLQTIAQSGDPAPGTNGVFTDEFGLDVEAFNLRINNRGDVLFSAVYEAGEPTFDTGVWLYRADTQELEAIVTNGQTLEVAPGDQRVVESAGYFGKHRLGGPRNLNDIGQVALSLSFTDGTDGIFLFDPFSGLPGDYNDSGQVEQGDLDLVLQNWGIDTDVAGIPAGWLNGLPLGQIEQNELDGVLQNWGGTAAPGFDDVQVPEPTATLAMGSAFLAFWRRRRT